MSDRMNPISFDQLIIWILGEYAKEKSIFGIPESKFYQHSGKSKLRLFDSDLENPLGPAAGPHTQLAQNIIAAYLCGGRFFELKTVQILDGKDLPVSKPCILASDEGYNVEWSTELTVPDALNEYIKAWFGLHILAQELGLGSSTGFIFNMSVGYDLAGIQSPKIDSFINGLKDASQTSIWQVCRKYLLDHLDWFHNVSREYVERISPNICNSITLSTLHGCPPQEIERIAKYLLAKKQLHTYVKCNPTLLGYQFTRELLDKLGYDYLAFDEHHFQNDLQFHDAVPMITRLQAFAKEHRLTFGVKLSNTFPVKICRRELPGEEMYMSGRALYPLTINLAYKLAKELRGDLKISYSGGADSFNLDKIFQSGIWPITLATTLLKPGGYLRMHQMAEMIDKVSQTAAWDGLDLERLKQLADNAMREPHHRKEYRKREGEGEADRKELRGSLPLADCFVAPCKEGCPIGQDIPEYIRLIGSGKYLEALELIVAKNPLPFITGTLCNHRCMAECTRLNYEQPVQIRAAKLFAAERAFDELMKKIERPNLTGNLKVAVIGAGPAGLAAAFFLGKSGIAVTVFDRKETIGGIIEHIAPDFRIARNAIAHDMELVRKMGAEFRLGVTDDLSVDTLKRQGFKYVFVAIGAWKPGVLMLDASDRKIINVLEFLEDYNKHRDGLKLGKKVAVVGAGNSAMDGARAAKRLPGVETVYVIYRRTRKEMPASVEELHLALAEGIQLKELLAPVAFTNGTLRCRQMELGAPDASGRRSPQVIPGQFVDLEIDTLIAAVGEKVETDWLIENGIGLDATGHIHVNPETNETNVADVYVGGDALRGPATIVEAIADGVQFAQTVLAKEKLQVVPPERKTLFDPEKQLSEIRAKKGILRESCQTATENSRCLECNVICNICTEVCPNRANVQIGVKSENFRCRNQVIHIDGICNECGNCATFCPYEGAPYRDKFTLYENETDFTSGENPGFVLVDKKTNHFKVRRDREIFELIFDTSGKYAGATPPELAAMVWTVYKDYNYLLK
jgi:putative selenate reductase